MSQHSTMFIGLGAIGLPMAQRLHEAGIEITGVDLSPDCRQRAQDLGLKAEASLDSAGSAATVIVMVATGSQLDAVLHGSAGRSDTGLLSRMSEGSVLVVMSTVGPAAVRAAAQSARERGIACLDVPVTGGVSGVESGRLRLLASGDPDVLDSRRYLLDALGTVIDCGASVGDGQAFKVVNQLLCSVHIVAAAEALALAQRLGLDQQHVLAAMTAGAAESWMLGDRGPRMLEGLDAEVRSAIGIFVKDTSLVAAEAADLDIELALLPVAEQKFAEAATAGLLDRDDSQVIRTYLTEG
nr:NAD(P)-dependent oxidoreductase [Brevibacterium sp.]